ncbi:MAG: alanine--glyoxylate aminotransferase family protein [archaeon]
MAEESWKKHVKLFIPGPVEVFPDVLEEVGRPMIGHRSQQFKDLYAECRTKLKEVLGAQDAFVFLSTSSATGVWEAAIRNCIEKKALCCACGAFSKKWGEVVEMNGREVDFLEVEMGQGITAEMIDEKLASGEYDALTFVHNETSAGVMNPIEEVAEVMKKYPDVMFLVDAVSSMTTVPIDVDKLGIDVCLASVQKAFSLPPGLAVFTVSKKAMEKSETMKNRGYYFDFQAFKKYDEKSQTPTTPAIPQIYGLHKVLCKMLEEGMENRYKRHAEMADYVRNWAVEKGFELFAQEGFRSNSLTAITNTKGINIADLNKALSSKHGMVLSNGYGDLKEKTFRIAHMGDMQLDDIKGLLAAVEQEAGL